MSNFDFLRLGPKPLVMPSSQIFDSQLGVYVYVGHDSIIDKSSIGDYSHIGDRNDIFSSKIGRFVSFASSVRINPVQHPTYSRIVQSHIAYRCEAYGS